jgi:hypothetical protein
LLASIRLCSASMTRTLLSGLRYRNVSLSPPIYISCLTSADGRFILQARPT